jgi:hypothetical protein
MHVMLFILQNLNSECFLVSHRFFFPDTWFKKHLSYVLYSLSSMVDFSLFDWEVG